MINNKDMLSIGGYLVIVKERAIVETLGRVRMPRNSWAVSQETYDQLKRELATTFTPEEIADYNDYARTYLNER